MGQRKGHLVTNLLSRACECGKCAAVASLCHPPIACRSPDRWIRRCRRRRWSHAAGTDGTVLRKRNKRPGASMRRKEKETEGGGHGDKIRIFSLEQIKMQINRRDKENNVMVTMKVNFLFLEDYNPAPLTHYLFRNGAFLLKCSRSLKNPWVRN